MVQEARAATARRVAFMSPGRHAKESRRKALAELSPEQRQVIELAYFSGMSQSEISLHLGQPLGTVKTRVRLGMIKLKESLAPMVSGF